ncbi:ATP/GTP-binding protein [Foetidibacter luteolus]|uniref:ATP/GTP-binding protein n=1 Tax=Foetidibacter luteolus TaxID=2608880 RepID=UPI00129BBC6E|nr:ATP/GTP-binding protein [Foetidibacter luteolus]
MKIVFVVCMSLSLCNAVTAQHFLQKIWETDSMLAVPESVILDVKNNTLYASLINGGGGKGGIAKVSTDGKIIDTAWITGLNAPKGSGIHNGLLYVANSTEVALIDIAKGAVLQKIPIDGAVFLNDITIDGSGTVYVSDSRAGKVYSIKNNQPQLLFENMENPNGLLAVGNSLYILAKGILYKADLATKQLTKIAEGMEPSTDGLQQVDDQSFIVTSWIGAVYYVGSNGSVQELLNTKADKINTADLYYDRNKKIAYIPTFFKKSVVAFELH